MADSIHMLLANFRESVLTSLAKLEFQIRDLNQGIPPLQPIQSIQSIQSVSSNTEMTEMMKKHSEDIDFLLTNLKIVYRTLDTLQEVKEEKTSFLQIQPVKDTKNVIVSTPALQAAVAMANDMESLHLDSDQEEETMGQLEVEEEKEEEEEQDVVESVESVEEGEVEEDQDEDENEENAVEVEEFTYKGTVYQRDEEGTVYLDGDEVGHWNGKKIIFDN